jgi:endothelin-converting enzyme/putative endopeptidase
VQGSRQISQIGHRFVTDMNTYENGKDDGIRPQDDLFGHVNGGWLESAEIPPDLPGFGAFVQLRLDAEKHVGQILEEASAKALSGEAPVGSTVQKIGDMYASFLDEQRTEELGADPILADLAAVDAVDDLSALAALLGRLEREGVSGLVYTYVDTDDRQADRYVVNMLQGGIGLPDESYYREEQFADIRKKYVAHVTAMLGLVYGGEPEAEAERIMALETRLAAAHWDRVASRDVVKTYNLTTAAQLREQARAFDWSAWTAGLGADGRAFGEVVVRQPSYLSALSEALVEVPLEDWKAWLRWNILRAAAPYLSSRFVDENFDFYSRVLAGTEEQRERWKRGVAVTESALGEAVGEQYVARHFPPEAKAQMDDLVATLVEAYRVHILKLDWMGEDTKQRALDKLAVFYPKIGYPPKWRDYSALHIDRTDLVGNVRRAAAFETDRQLAKIGRPVDRDEWLMYPQTVNAYYNPGTNEICFPAAILRPPFFDPDADPAYNYGGIGAVIGHEIGHGFDDQGSQYDGNGNLVNWWTDDDRARFNERAQALIEQYSQFEPRALPGHKVNGALTVGENIGDLGGLTIALAAYEISLAGEQPPVVDGLTGRQRVFYNWALVWRSKRRRELDLQYLSVDPHSPPEFRANIVRNLDEFHDEFDTRPGDGLWLAPEDRVHIW